MAQISMIYFNKSLLKQWRKSVKTSQDIYCPRCGKVGQLKHRRKHGTYYMYVDHYLSHKRIGGFHGKYVRSCYIKSSRYLVGIKNNRLVLAKS